MRGEVWPCTLYAIFAVQMHRLPGCAYLVNRSRSARRSVARTAK